MRTWEFIIAMMVMTIAAYAAPPASHPATVPATTQSTTRHWESDNHFFAVDYPRTWQRLVSKPPLVLWLRMGPKGTVENVRVETRAGNLDDSAVEGLADAVAAQAGDAVEKSDFTIDGQHAKRLTYTTKDARPAKVCQIIAVRSRTTVSIVYMAAPEDFDKRLHEFESFLSTFKWIKSR